MNSSEIFSRHRSSLLYKNIAVSITVKGWSALIALLLVPITLNCLGEYTNGVWLTISSMQLWIDNLDIGLGNGLRNKLAACMAHNDVQKAKRLISSTFAILTCIMLLTIVILVAIVLYADTYGFLNVNPHKVTTLDTVLIIVIILVCSTFVFKLIGNFYMGLQLPAVSNILVAMGQTLTLVATFAIYHAGSHSLVHIALVNTVPPFIVYLMAFPYTFYHKYPELCPSLSLASFKEAVGVMNLGGQFFIMQISGVILFMSSNILVSKLFSPAMVTPYQIVYRYFSLFLVISNVICMPFWSATTDAYERGDIKWIVRASHKLRLITLGIFGGIIIMLLASDFVYRLWIGNDISIDFKMSVAMAVYIFILIYSIRYSFFINGIGALRLQLIMTSTAAILFIPLAYAATLWTHSITCFIAVMCLVNLPGLIVNRIQFSKLINGTASGIWKK